MMIRRTLLPSGRSNVRSRRLARVVRSSIVLAGVFALAAVIVTAAASRGQRAAASLAKTGGTLYLLGNGDVDYMDPNVSYYTVGQMGMRMWSRNLMTYPAVAGKTTDISPDLAVAPGKVSAGGLVYRFTIRKGAMWDTKPARQVTAADAVLGLKRSCNPVKPSAALPDYESLVAGMTQFCNAFAKVKPTIGAIAAFIHSHALPGATVDPSNPLTVVYKLVHPASYFPALLGLGAFAPAPQEYLSYLPVSSALAQHTISDGPYAIASYNPGKSIDFVRNPAWKPSSDPIRKAYVNEIKVDETVNQNTVQQELQTNSANANAEWGDSQPPPAQLPGLIASHNPNLILGPTLGLDPFIIFNFVDPNQNGAMKNLNIRRGISYALNRTQLVQDAAGPKVSPPLTHVLPPHVLGSHDFDVYPYNVAKAKSLLGSTQLSLKLLYEADNQVQAKMFQTVQFQLSKVGIKVTGVGVPTADIYTKYLLVPSVARRGVWDIAFDQWYPDWYGDNTVNYFLPIFSSKSWAPAGANLNLYKNPTVDKLIDEGASATSNAKAAAIWARVDRLIMEDAAVYSVLSPNFAIFHSNAVHGALFVPSLQGLDPTNVWLSS
jgi:peptide/nickel transport system substrate-binding protein